MEFVFGRRYSDLWRCNRRTLGKDNLSPFELPETEQELLLLQVPIRACEDRIAKDWTRTSRIARDFTRVKTVRASRVGHFAPTSHWIVAPRLVSMLPIASLALPHWTVGLQISPMKDTLRLVAGKQMQTHVCLSSMVVYRRLRAWILNRSKLRIYWTYWSHYNVDYISNVLKEWELEVDPCTSQVKSAAGISWAQSVYWHELLVMQTIPSQRMDKTY